MTKMRLQFLTALCLVILPVLGFPVWLDSILVSLGGICIATTTFLVARERRLQTKSATIVEEDIEYEEAIAPVVVEADKKPRTIRRRTPKKQSSLSTDEQSVSILETADDIDMRTEVGDQSHTQQVADPIPSPLTMSPVRRTRTRKKAVAFTGNDSDE